VNGAPLPVDDRSVVAVRLVTDSERTGKRRDRWKKVRVTNRFAVDDAAESMTPNRNLRFALNIWKV